MKNINSDGASRGGGDTLGYGGHSDERLIKNYVKKIETCDTLHSEMWSMYLTF
jgi:hypothetical protein